LREFPERAVYKTRLQTEEGRKPSKKVIALLSGLSQTGGARGRTSGLWGSCEKRRDGGFRDISKLTKRGKGTLWEGGEEKR